MKSASAARLGVAIAGLASLAAGAAAAAAECAGKAGGPTLEVEVVGLRAAKGQVAVTVYPDQARRFLAPGGKLLRVRETVTLPATRACFHLPQAGHYAIAVYHDANSDQDFNRTIVGLPAEGFGFSNDVPTPTALPPFQAVRFRVASTGGSLRIRMRYLR